MGESSRRSIDNRAVTVVIWLSLLLFLIQPGLAQARDPLALLVVVPERLALDALEVERWMDLLKVERERQRLAAEEVPLLRLSMGRGQHRAVLQKLGLQPDARIRTFTCRRGADGWPSELIVEHEEGSAPDQVLARLVKQRQSPDSVAAPTIGLLLVVGSDEGQQASQAFLEELAAFWLQRYGRIRPSPYPLASYNVALPEVEEALNRVFPQLEKGREPLVALCVYAQGRPVEILQVFSELDTPASLVRELSAARTNALLSVSKTAGAGATEVLPASHQVGLSQEQERFLLVSRLHETGQQLWASTREDASLRNQGPKRVLLRVVEDSRRFLANEPQAWMLLQESLRDYEVEPLLIERHNSSLEQAARFLELGRSLLEIP